MNRRITKLIYFFVIIQLVFFSTSCEDERDQIPNVKFKIILHIPTELADLPVSGSKIFKKERGGGFNGLVIHRKRDNVFQAFERTCTYYPIDNCVVDIEDFLFAVCPCCDSKFELPSDGIVIRGPARFSLKQYNTTITNDYLTIYN